MSEATPPDGPDDEILPALLSYVRQRKCALFVGAGLSRPAGYPGWGDLMRLVVEKTGRLANIDTPELSALLEGGKYADVADECREILGRTQFSLILRHALAKGAAPPEATHRAIVQTPYACIVTTNFDTLLEDAYRLWSDVGVPKAPTGVGLGSHGTLLLDGAFFILKAHGTIHDDASMVFTTDDYRRIIHQSPAFTAMMSAILLSHAVLFVGYSLGDANFRLLLESQLTTFGSQAPPRYAVMEAVGDHEREILRRTAGIEVISYPKGDHRRVARVLRLIADRTSGPPSPPRQVLRELEPQPAVRVSIRPHGPRLDLRWFLTKTDDLGTGGVPLEERYAAEGNTLDWPEISGRMEAAVHGGPRRDRPLNHVGSLLTSAVPALCEYIATLPSDTLVVLDPAPELAAVPWEWLIVDGQPLVLRSPVCRVSPVLDDDSRGRPFVRSPLSALLIGDTTSERPDDATRLPGARDEVERIAHRFRHAAHGRVTLLVGAEATYDRVLRELSECDYDVVHFAGHAWYGPGGTYLEVHDGRVRAAELMTLLIRRPPLLLFLNSHYTGFVPAFTEAFPLDLPVGSAFDDFYRLMRRRRPGLEHAVARAGVGTFVGCLGSPADGTAAQLAIAFYQRLHHGSSAAEALHRARPAICDQGDTTPMLYAMAGYPDLRFGKTTISR